MAAKNHDGLMPCTLFYQKIDWNATYQETFELFFYENVEYWPKEHFQPFKFLSGNPRWRQNPKWRPKTKKSYICCQMA
jgi:hypothetical protein